MRHFNENGVQNNKQPNAQKSLNFENECFWIRWNSCS